MWCRLVFFYFTFELLVLLITRNYYKERRPIYKHIQQIIIQLYIFLFYVRVETF